MRAYRLNEHRNEKPPRCSAVEGQSLSDDDGGRRLFLSPAPSVESIQALGFIVGRAPPGLTSAPWESSAARTSLFAARRIRAARREVRSESWLTIQRKTTPQPSNPKNWTTCLAASARSTARRLCRSMGSHRSTASRLSRSTVKGSLPDQRPDLRFHAAGVFDLHTRRRGLGVYCKLAVVIVDALGAGRLR